VASEGKRKTRLREVRDALGFNQDEAALRTGLSLRTYQRLEAGELENPPIRHLTNCALGFGVELEEVCQPEWLAWKPPHSKMSEPLPVDGPRRTGLERLRSSRRGS